MAPETELTLPVSEQDHTRGPATALVTLVMYGDYQCPYTALANRFVAELREELGERLRLVYRHFPLADVHPDAERAAEAAETDAALGQFWEMHEMLFANQRALAPEQIKEYARQLGLDMAKFEADLQSDEVKSVIQEDGQLAQRVGVRGTPTIFVNGKVLQNRSLDGFKQLIDPALKDAAAQNAAGQRPGS
jgi:protein-disulfide isomerase